MINHERSNLSLSVITPNHVDQLLDWRNNPKIFKWCRQRDLIEVDKHREWFASLANRSDVKMYLVMLEKTKPIGVCGLTSIDLENQRAEFSLYISADNQGRGYGRSALKLLLHHAFQTYPLNIIYGESFHGNKAIEMFKEIGFKEEGVRRDFYFKDGVFKNALLFSIKRSEFNFDSNPPLKIKDLP